MKEKIKKLYTKLERGFVELLEFPFKGILNSFILAIAVILVILLIAAMGRSFGATGTDKKNKIRSGYEPSKALEISKLNKKTQKIKKN